MYITNKHGSFFDVQVCFNSLRLVDCVIHKDKTDMYSYNDRLTGCDLGALNNELVVTTDYRVLHQGKDQCIAVVNLESFINNYKFN